jgi:hypothetical protein
MRDMKSVVSIRLSEEMLSELEEAARRLGVSRSQAVEAAIDLLLDLISGKCELKYEPKRFDRQRFRWILDKEAETS